MMPPPVAEIAAELGLRHPVVTPLSGGLSNRSWRLRDCSQDLVLRQSGASASQLGADGRAEFAMLRIAAGAGLAPQVVLARPDTGILVTRYIGGHVPTREEIRRPAMLARIGAWFAKLHALEPPQGFAAVDFGERAAGYLGMLRAQAPTDLIARLEQRLAVHRESLPPPRRLAPCHHDLHHLNLVDSGDALVALDWEYAGPGDPAADLAACICYHDLEAQQVDALLAGRDGDAGSLHARLPALRWIFDCLWLGWMEVAALGGITMDDGRRQRLVERLSS
ncbi:MAG: phosphotransferase [Steroidobacteraceae bacterium]